MIYWLTLDESRAYLCERVARRHRPELRSGTMFGPCLIVDPEASRSGFLTDVIARAGGTDIVAAALDPDILSSFEAAPSPKLAIIAVCDPQDAQLDLMSVLRSRYPDCLILAVDALDTPESAARPFAAGAHDVLRIPLRPTEIEARIAQGLTRMAPEKARIDEAANDMIGRFNLTQVEARVLRFLSARQGQIVSRDDLSQHLYGQPWTYGDRRFDVHITRIRRKLTPQLGKLLKLKTVRSMGYKLELESPAGD